MPVELYPPRPWNFLPFLEGPRGSAPHSNGQSGERKASGRASISKWALECCALRERTTDPQACKRQATFLYQQPPTQSVVFLCHARSLKSVEALFEQIPQCQRNVILVLTSSIPSTYVLGNAALGPVIRRLVASSSFMPTSRELTEAARIESPLSTTAR